MTPSFKERLNQILKHYYKYYQNQEAISKILTLVKGVVPDKAEIIGEESSKWHGTGWNNCIQQFLTNLEKESL